MYCIKRGLSRTGGENESCLGAEPLWSLSYPVDIGMPLHAACFVTERPIKYVVLCEIGKRYGNSVTGLYFMEKTFSAL